MPTRKGKDSDENVEEKLENIKEKIEEGFKGKPAERNMNGRHNVLSVTNMVGGSLILILIFVLSVFLNQVSTATATTTQLQSSIVSHNLEQAQTFTHQDDRIAQLEKNYEKLEVGQGKMNEKLDRLLAMVSSRHGANSK
jgi:Tfp pilus assembly protein PilN